jgi:hypothetical protein
MEDFDYLGFDYPLAQEDLWALEWIARVKVLGKHEHPTCIEIGSYVGRSALMFDMLFDRVVCVDSWSPYWAHLNIPGFIEYVDVVYNTFLKNISDRLLFSIFPFRFTSLEASCLITVPFDFIYLDADQSLQSVTEDLAAWKTHLMPGGVIAFHNYSWRENGKDITVLDLCPGAQVERSMAYWINE